MSIHSIHLRKLLKLLFLPNASRISALRQDIREDIARETGEDEGGGDFHAPFWADAKSHVFNGSNIYMAVEQRIQANPRRARLYPVLRDGFLLWWNERRRWTNSPFQAGTQLKAQISHHGVNGHIKIDNILSARDNNGIEHYVYPYFSEDPPLSEEAARLGLWALCHSLGGVPPTEIRILDVIRGQTFSIDRTPLSGNEQHILLQGYSQLLAEWDILRQEYQ